MRILMVKDEQRPGSPMLDQLIEAGFTIDSARDARDALSMMRICDYDLMITDAALRGIDGQALVQHMRFTGNCTPALVFADSELLFDQMLAAGADDVLMTSAVPTELLLRVQALVRTFAGRSGATPTRLSVADLELDTALRRSFRARRQLDLTHGEFSTLELLMHRYGEVVSRTLIASSGLPNSKRSPEAIDVHMSRLRRKVDGNATRKLVHTVRRAGFVLEDRGVCL
jgi:two-component system OmpR family response regulator